MISHQFRTLGEVATHIAGRLKAGQRALTPGQSRKVATCPNPECGKLTLDIRDPEHPRCIACNYPNHISLQTLAEQDKIERPEDAALKAFYRQQERAKQGE